MANLNDLKISWADFLEGDLSTGNNDLVTDAGLETAVLISLFTDRRADDDDELPDPDNPDRRGWWGDLITDIPEDKIGSKLWLLERSKTTEQTLVDAERFIKESVQWLIDDGVASSIDVIVERQGEPDWTILAFQIKIKKLDGRIISVNFDNRWTAQLN